MEQQVLYNSINFVLQATFLSDFTGVYGDRGAYGNLTAIRTTLPTLLCPSDGGGSRSPFGMNHYRANAGICDSCTDGADTGAFQVLVASPLAGFSDGLSQTLAFSEKLGGSEPSRYSPRRDWLSVPMGLTVAGREIVTSDAMVAACSRQTDPGLALYDAGHTWLLAGAFYTLFYTCTPPNSIVPDCGGSTNNGVGVFTARSQHPGGVNAAMADGSVRWTGSTIDPAIWRALGTRSRGEITP